MQERTEPEFLVEAKNEEVVKCCTGFEEAQAWSRLVFGGSLERKSPPLMPSECVAPVGGLGVCCLHSRNIYIQVLDGEIPSSLLSGHCMCLCTHFIDGRTEAQRG